MTQGFPGENPVFATVFPRAVDPPRPTIQVVDANLMAGIDQQIRAIEQLLVSAGMASVFGGIYATGVTTAITTSTPLACTGAFGPVKNTVPSAASGAITITQAGPVLVSFGLSGGTSTATGLVVFALTQNGTGVPGFAAILESTGTPDIFVGASAAALVQCAAGDVLQIVATGVPSTSFTYYATLVVTTPGALQGLQGIQGVSSSAAPGALLTGLTNTVATGNTVTVGNTTSAVACQFGAGASDGETKLFIADTHGSADFTCTPTGSPTPALMLNGIAQPAIVLPPGTSQSLVWIAALGANGTWWG